MAFFFFLIGPAGSGKSTIGRKIKKELKFKFFEGDKFHSKNNIHKMKIGIKLKFRDRLPWLLRINKTLKKYNNFNDNYIVACSALKKNYRNILSRDLNYVFFIYLKCKKKKLIKRSYYRKHFFSPTLVKDQILNFEKSSDLININANKNITNVTKIVKRRLKKILKSVDKCA